MRRRIVTGLIVAATLATAGIAYAENQPTDPSVASTAPATPGQKARPPKAAKPRAEGDKASRAGGVLKGAVHGDLLVRNEDGSTRTVTFDRGKVTAISAGSITIQRPDGVSVAKDLNDQTVFNGTPRDQLQVGAGAVVISEGSAARRVLSKGAAKARAEAACAAAPAKGAAPAGDEAGKGLRPRIKAKVCERLEQRKQRRAGKKAGGTAGQGDEAPSVAPSSMLDDGLETIVS